MSRWFDLDPTLISHRYDKLAPIYPIFEYVFWLPRDARSRAVETLQLHPGDRVLEVGCGTGRNLPLLVGAVGREGHVYGVDISKGMLRRAERERARRGWDNVTLVRADARDCLLPEPVDGVLFSFSYEVIPRYREALRSAWAHLRPEGTLVVLGQTTPRGTVGRLLRPLGVLTSRATVLGDPDRSPWKDLTEMTERVDVQELSYGYYICRGRKGGSRTSAGK